MKSQEVDNKRTTTRNEDDILTNRKDDSSCQGEKFTPEEIQILSENPNTFEVSTYRLAFTAEAKERILELYAAGKCARSIVTEFGYDLDIRLKFCAENACFSFVRRTKRSC